MSKLIGATAMRAISPELPLQHLIRLSFIDRGARDEVIVGVVNLAKSELIADEINRLVEAATKAEADGYED